MTGEPTTVGAGIGLDAMTGRATQTARTTYLVLLTALPTDTTTLATMAELTTPATNGYNRQSVTWSTPAGDPAETHNTNVITFGAFTSDLANVPYVALVSALTGTTGDFLFFWTLAVARDPANGDSISLAASALSATAD